MLNKISRAGALSPAGKDFLIACLDPMHDKQLSDLEGWPDVECSNSIVRCIKQTISITKPAGLTAGMAWDCHISQWPMMNQNPVTKYTRSIYGNNILDSRSAGVTTNFGGCTAFGVDAGTAFSFTAPVMAGQLSLDEEYEEGASRIVGCGIEVVNTTAELYKQGSVTVFRNNQSNMSRSSTFTLMISGQTHTEDFPSGAFVRRPPFRASDAMLIPGSRTWRAEDGCYLVSSFVGQDNPPLMPDYVQPVIFGDPSDEDQQVNANNSSVYFSPGTTTGAPFPVNGRFYPAQKIHPLHMAGAVFTGLSEQTTLNITMNVYVETFPTVGQKSILVLATPSARYDPVALEILSQALCAMPVGVPAAMNGLGEWFAGAVRAAATVVPGIALALGRPLLAAGLGGGLSLASKGIDAYLASPSAQTQPRLTAASGQTKKKKKKNKLKERSTQLAIRDGVAQRR